MLQDNLLCNVFRNQMVCKNLAFALHSKKQEKEEGSTKQCKNKLEGKQNENVNERKY